MHREDLMKPDLFSEIVLLGSGGLIFVSLLLIVFVVRSSESSLAPGPSYGLSFSSTLGFWFQRPKL